MDNPAFKEDEFRSFIVLYCSLWFACRELKYIVYYIALYIAIISWMGKLKSYTPVGFAFYDEGCEFKAYHCLEDIVYDTYSTGGWRSA